MSGGERPAKLVYMANQIATFFRAQGEDAAAGVAAHLKAFWDPSMRAEITAWVEAGGDGLSPIAAEGVRRLPAGGAAQPAGGDAPG